MSGFGNAHPAAVPNRSKWPPGEVIAKLRGSDGGFRERPPDGRRFRDAARKRHQQSQWKGAKDRVEKLRAVKEDVEIEQIREAIRIAERAFDMFRAMLRPDDSEKD